MAPIYTYQNLLDDARKDASGISNILRLANRATTFVTNDIDLRSTKRMAFLSPGLNENQYDYQAPTDLKELALVDIRKVAARQEYDKFNLVTTEYFDRNKANNKNLVCVEDRDWIKKLRISADLDEPTSYEVVVSDCESLTADGNWAASGNASNLTLDSDWFVHGIASFNFDMATSYTSGLLTVSNLTSVDLSDFETGGSIFVIVYIPDTTGLTSFKLRIGSDASNYYEKTVTVTNENLAFYTGINLLRFDFASATKTGTVDMENLDYVRLEIVGAGTATASTDWRLDYIVARRGRPHEIWYYTKYPWQSSSGTYLENSTATTDLLNADTEEYDLFVLKLKELIAIDAEEFTAAADFASLYKNKKITYQSNYPSERLKMIQQITKFQDSPGESWLN